MSRAARTIKGDGRPSSHLILWTDTQDGKSRTPGRDWLRPAGPTRAWLVDSDGSYVECVGPIAVQTSGDIVALACGAEWRCKSLTVWLPRGWIDLVLSGFTSLFDSGQYTYRFGAIDGAKVVFAGKLSGKSVNLTSFASWTGGAWDAWRDAIAEDATVAAHTVLKGSISPQDQFLVSMVATVLASCDALAIGPPRLSMGSAGRAVWRSWLGPVTQSSEIVRGKRGHKAKVKVTESVCPLPGRPRAAAASERQCCYALPREQYLRGHVGGPVYVVDMRCAYLTGLLMSPVPTCYSRRVSACDAKSLASQLEGMTGAALVSIDSPDRPYPVRLHGRPGRAVGRYWTWLAGEELRTALAAGHVSECNTAWLWHCTQYPLATVRLILSLRDECKERGWTGLAAFWRSCYSSLIGSFAQWRREWVDSPVPAGFGPWSSWSHYDPHTGEQSRYRSIAGRVQKQVLAGDAPGALPLVYAITTGTVRTMTQRVTETFPEGSLLAQAADALWLTEAGWQHARETAGGLEARDCGLRAAARYDDAWLDGRGRAVVELGGRRTAVVQGVPGWSEMDAEGRCVWRTVAPWSKSGAPSADTGVLLGRGTFKADRLIKDNSYPLRAVRPWIELAGGELREELLLPLDPTKRRPDHDPDEAV